MATDEPDPRLLNPASVVEGEITTTVRLVRAFIAALVVAAVVAGVVRGFATSAEGKDAVVSGMLLTETALAAILILLGSLVEGFGFGLSLGTNWPYTRNILVLLVRGDPEAAHRLVATLVGLIGVALVALVHDSQTISGLVLVVVTALFGVGTLHVLAGRLPSIVHGSHGLLAYGVFLCYLSALYLPGVDFWQYLKVMSPLHCLLLAVFLGGMTTGQRGFGKPIGAFDVPRTLPQLVTIARSFSTTASSTGARAAAEGVVGVGAAGGPPLGGCGASCGAGARSARAAAVIGPTMPSALSLRSRWKALTARSVAGPKTPSIVPTS